MISSGKFRSSSLFFLIISWPFEVQDCMTDHGRDVALEEVQGSGNQDLVGLWVNSESDHFDLS